MKFLVVQAVRINYGRIYLEEEELSTPRGMDKKQVTGNTKVRTLTFRCIWTHYLPHSQQYVLILLQSLRHKLLSARGTAAVQLTTTS